ncbi:bifunctional phosphoribosyl-AMP cyclohydrolase/phosphoribosyl-ATP diphosphatase HisIE [Paenibacillus sp.]|jgi:phosphoribosyl-ATP pyrophosphohydrolase/phosphoribosyl-AMP cyclohydrolase|uniref:bifunctional phosphoribosyl-AMP cyclohydrolase/phosphoribosyl-ATP diphosphatase HisIE n=1 Tax=Paenibacillus sp. TaxID=58172 RepID=UPI00281719AF|nr:bifunctional phosphoribosyl-AMP cyclohydrolase/phosphoribosyl-ATP diphosphatase HisIE [Paenibacillus sp.]MDR0268899.1 bifunctional phosphoribosyl-AMP cyclohydrolase/phosphoribosyl-ATP diphosphatase HisIE [Paenibacillus sp.]
MSGQSKRQTWEQVQENIHFDSDGLVPAIVQDATSKEVLMMAYMNQESLQRSLETGETWFWSRSRQELWHKGRTSGNTQSIVSAHYDCDGDTLLFLVRPTGPACHTGETTCFYRGIESPAIATSEETGGKSTQDRQRFAVLEELEQIIAEREKERPEGAYTTYLFDKGVDKILKKVGEETAETIIAAKNKDNAELRLEVSDLLYHLLVLLQERKLPLDDVMSELERRHERPRRD